MVRTSGSTGWLSTENSPGKLCPDLRQATTSLLREILPREHLGPGDLAFAAHVLVVDVDDLHRGDVEPDPFEYI